MGNFQILHKFINYFVNLKYCTNFVTQTATQSPVMGNVGGLQKT